MSEKVLLSTQKVIDIDLKKIDIFDYENNDKFWLHHGHQEDDKLELFRYCKMLPEVLKKLNNNEKLSGEEKYAYDLYYGERKPQLHQEENGKITISDGRHRMAALIVTGISIPMEVTVYREFEPVKQKQTIAQEYTHKQNHTFSSFIQNIFGKYNKNKHNYTVFDAVSDITNNSTYYIGYISVDNKGTKEKLLEHLNKNPEIWYDFYGKNYSVFNVNNELNEESLDDFLDKIDVDKRTVLVSKEKQCYDEER